MLIIAFALLFGQLIGPAVVHWWWRPRPGKIGIEQYVSGTDLAAQFAVFLPWNDCRDSRWPLVVYLRGSGDRGQDAKILTARRPFDVIQNGTELPAILVAPLSLPNCQWRPDSVFGFIQHVTSKYWIERRQINLIGHSMGGFETWATANAQPDVLAGIVPICGGGGQ